MNTDRRRWFRASSQLKGSVLPAVLSRVILCGIFGFLVSTIQNLQNLLGLSLALPLWGGLIPNIVLGLLLIFQINKAYERFKEGRKSWGTLVNTVHNLSRQIWVAIREIVPGDRTAKVTTIRLLVAFAVATKLHLRAEPINGELEALLPPERYLKLQTLNNPPLQIALWIGDYLQQQYQRKCISGYQLTALQKLLDKMVDSLGACERLIKTPMSLADAIHLKQLVLIYCLLLPFQLVGYLQWSTGLIVALISFVVFGIEEISSEMENPFGYDYDDLPLDANCDMMLRNIEELISLEPDERDRHPTLMS